MTIQVCGKIEVEERSGFEDSSLAKPAIIVKTTFPQREACAPGSLTAMPAAS
jgi:hypothetical protein